MATATNIKLEVLNKSTDQPYGVTKYRITYSVDVLVTELDDREKFYPQNAVDYINKQLVTTMAR